MAVDVTAEPVLRVSEPRRLFESDYVVGRYASDSKNYDVTPDGGFVFVRYDRNPAPTRLHVVLNWTKELERLVPVGPS